MSVIGETAITLILNFCKVTGEGSLDILGDLYNSESAIANLLSL